MNNFNEIIQNIEAELSELKKSNEELKRLNKDLMKENASLREQLKLPNNKEQLSIEEAFKLFYIKDDTQRLKTRAYNALIRYGTSHDYEYISDLNGKSIYDIFKIRNLGVAGCAVIVIVAEHFGEMIKFPNCDDLLSTIIKRKEILKVKEKITEYREKIVFK